MAQKTAHSQQAPRSLQSRHVTSPHTHLQAPLLPTGRIVISPWQDQGAGAGHKGEEPLPSLYPRPRTSPLRSAAIEGAPTGKVTSNPGAVSKDPSPAPWARDCSPLGLPSGAPRTGRCKGRNCGVAALQAGSQNTVSAGLASPEASLLGLQVVPFSRRPHSAFPLGSASPPSLHVSKLPLFMRRTPGRLQRDPLGASL